MITLVLGFSATSPGGSRRVRIRTDVIDGWFRHWVRTSLPMKPVLPDKTTFMLGWRWDGIRWQRAGYLAILAEMRCFVTLKQYGDRTVTGILAAYGSFLEVSVVACDVDLAQG